MVPKGAPSKTTGIAWEEPSKTNDIFIYLGPIFTNARFIGICPFDIEMETSFLRIVLSLVLVSIMLSTGAVYAYYTFGIPWTTWPNAIVYMTTVVLAIFTTACVVLLTIYKRSKQRLALDRIREIDSKLLTMGILFKYDRKEILSEIFLRAFFKILMVVFDWVIYHQSIRRISGPTLIASLYYSYFIIYNMQHQYTAMMKVVCKHFSVISKRAKVHVSNKDVIHRLLEVHFELCEVCEIVNDWFSPQLLLVCNIVFFSTTLNLDAMFMALISFLDPLPPQITIFVSCTFWVVARIYEMWEILDICAKTEEQAEELGKGLSKMIIDDEIKNDDKLLEIHFHLQPKLSITASGFFRLNNSVFQSMLASATTYVVIIVQVQPQMKGILCIREAASTMLNSSTTSD